MKKVILFLLGIALSNITFAQRLPKNALLGVHILTVHLAPGATMDEFENFFVTKVLPEYEKNWDGLQGYLLQSARGTYKNRFAVMWLFASEAQRNKYFNADDTPNELEKAAYERMKPIEEALKKYGTYNITYMDDWIVQ